MNFYSSEFLLQHCQDILKFYDDKVVDPSGGYLHNYLDDGTLFAPGFRQLVSSTHIIVNYVSAGLLFGRDDSKAIAEHGLKYREQVHWREHLMVDGSGGYAWTLQDHEPLDNTQQAYGYAFVMLAYAAAVKAGLRDKTTLHRVYQLLETRFWQADFAHGALLALAAGDLRAFGVGPQPGPVVEMGQLMQDSGQQLFAHRAMRAVGAFAGGAAIDQPR